jgi:LmbE family N-acetylglucosaminyl deacetylase
MNVVVYVSHVDDDILGAGGLIPRVIEAGHNVDIVYATDASSPRKDGIDKKPLALEAGEEMGVPAESIHFLGFTEMEFDDYPLIDINRRFSKLELDPDVIITNSKNDVNQDHDRVFRSALIVGRSINKKIGILSCEIISSSEWHDTPFDPDMYIDISHTIDTKVSAMKKIQPEVREWPHPRSPKGIRVKAEQRGMEVGCEYAEAYHVVRWFDFDEPLTA